MTPRSFALATALVLGLTGLAQAQARSTWQEPERRPAGAQAQPAQASPQARTQEAQAMPPRDPAPAVREAQAPRETAPATRPRPDARPRAERRREVRAARYRGGSGATWKTGRDSHGFAGSFGGCRFRGSAGPNGYRLDRSC